MTLSRLPLSYCSNVHPGRSLAEVDAALDKFTTAVRQRFGKPMAAGLWLADPVVEELRTAPDSVAKFMDRLAERDLSCHTLNAFPFGNFHDVRVKEKVYLPDWASAERLEYTTRCAAVLASLLPPDVDGSISTVPLGFKGFDHPPEFRSRCLDNLIGCAISLAALRRDSGKTIRLAVEPEPFCELETTAETVAFFGQLFQHAEAQSRGEIVREHIGVCFDVCHQAVEFEDVASSVRAIDAAGVRINKVHISSAVRLERPADNPDGVAALRRYVEPRYLHQTFGRLAVGRLVRAIDLTDDLLSNPGPDFLAAEEWRVHFHVPVDAENLGPLGTTRTAICEALAAVAELDYAPHLEVETYTWAVLPGEGPVDLVSALTRELEAADVIRQSVLTNPRSSSV